MFQQQVMVRYKELSTLENPAILKDLPVSSLSDINCIKITEDNRPLPQVALVRCRVKSGVQHYLFFKFTFQ